MPPSLVFTAMDSDENESAPDSEESELTDETEDVGDTEDAEDKGEWVEKGPEVKKDVDEREEEVAVCKVERIRSFLWYSIIRCWGYK